MDSNIKDTVDINSREDNGKDLLLDQTCNLVYVIKSACDWYVPFDIRTVCGILSANGIKPYGSGWIWKEKAYSMRDMATIVKRILQIQIYLVWEKNRTLPNEWMRFYEYYPDCGHNINCIISSRVPDDVELSDLGLYICPVPVKYVIEKGCYSMWGYLWIDAPYNKEYGLDVSEEYSEYQYSPRDMNGDFLNRL